MKAETQPLAQFEMLAAPRMRFLPSEDYPVHRPAFGRAAADQSSYPVLCHKIHGPRGAALDRLPAFDREPQRARYHGQFLERVAAIRDLRRQCVILAAMREQLLVESPEDDVDLFFEELAVGRLVEQRRAEGFDFPRVVTAPDAENNASASQNIRRRIIFGQSQRMPHRRDIEAAADLQTLGDMGEMQRRHQDIRDAFIPFVLKMVLGHPEGIVTDTIHQLRHRLGFVEHARQVFVGKSTVVHRSTAITDIVHVDVSREQTVEFRDHAGSSRGNRHQGLAVHLRPRFTPGNPEPVRCRAGALGSTFGRSTGRVGKWAC